jgi:hypothetical protein
MTTPSQQPDQQREAYVSLCRQALREFFRFRNAPFYFRQLQVLFETQFFHITTTQAVYHLLQEGFLTRIPYHSKDIRLEFVAPARLCQDQSAHRALRAHISTKARVVAQYSRKLVTDDLGDHLEALVRQELRANQLTNIQRNANSYKGTKWTESDHNLDFIGEHYGGQAFGVEVKNELTHIDFAELSVKLRMCQHLGLRPLFVVRYMPWSFVPLVRDRGGYVVTLGNQLYPLGYQRLVSVLKAKLSLPGGAVSLRLKNVAPKIRREWPVEVRTDLPQDVTDRLTAWFGSTTAESPQS